MGVPGNANALLLRTVTAAATGISRSLRFNSADSAYLSRTPASAGNRKTWTWAGWVKRSALSSSSEYTLFGMQDDVILAFAQDGLKANVIAGSNALSTTQVFRDASAWYHVVFAIDTTSATANNRVRVYINGSEVTQFSSRNNPSQNADTNFNQASVHFIGRQRDADPRYLSGYLADIYFIDGQALDPTSFGEFDATTGVWNPKAYTGSYGTNGFHLEFADNSAATATTLGKDTSGNGNNFTPSNLSVSSTPNAIQFPSGVSSVDYLVVGGGGGAGGDLSGGGGGGGVLASSTSITSSSLYQVIVGAGGSGNTGNTAGSNGGDSRFGSIVAYGGGGGGGDNGVPTTGGSGGGGSTGGSNSSARTGAAGTSGQGYAGGNGFGYPGGPGGGGGAGGAGSNGTTSTGGGGNGGIGATSSITGTSTYYGGGGGGAGDTRLSGGAGTGGQGGGGNGAFTSGGAGSNGTANTGGGGGGGSQFGGDGGNGGSGVVVIRYADTNPDLSFIGSSLTYTKTTSGGYKIYSFTASSSVLSDPGNDSVVDVPTNGAQTDTGVGGEVRGNYCTWNPLSPVNSTYANGNLDVTIGSNGRANSTFSASSGKWYWEATMTAQPSVPSYGLVGIGSIGNTGEMGNSGSESWGYRDDGLKRLNNSATSYGASYTVGDVIGIAWDADNGTLTFYKNGVSQGQAFTSVTGNYGPVAGRNGNPVPAYACNFGQRAFAYTAPSGFKALCTANLPAPSVTKPSTVMDVKTYTGNGSTQNITGLGFSPDLVWIKRRDSAAHHVLFDAIRGAGANKELVSSGTFEEGNTSSIATQEYGYLSAFNSDGFSVASGTVNGTYTNLNSSTYVGWAWDAGTSTVTNTAGSITSSVRANATAGFSIVTYTGTSSNGTVGHGLGVAPGLIFVKARSTTSAWQTYHVSTGKDYTLQLNNTNAQTNVSNFWGSTTPSSTVFGTLTGYDNNISGATMVAYCFAPVVGYSAMGSYVGNGSSDGSFIYTGHRSRWIMIKATSVANESWIIIDTARSTYNVVDAFLRADTSGAEFSSSLRYVDILSNGFKLRASGAEVNGSGTTYVYASFAESPFNYARAR
jgi:hypothetical protein